jgi:hypothetical protein
MEYSHVELQTYRGVDRELYSGIVTTVAVDTKATPEDVMVFKEATFFLKCSAFAGATLDVKIVSYDPATAAWYDLVAFTQLSGTGSERKAVTGNLGSKIAVVVTPAGAGNKTLKVGANFKIM